MPTSSLLARCSFFAAATLGIAAASATSAVGQTIRIRAEIDGRSRIILDGTTAQWHQYEFAAPGRLDCDIGEPIQATFLDGIAWFPQWPDTNSCENRDCDCDSDLYAGILPGLPDAPFDVQLQVVECRGTCAVVEQPTPDNGYRVVVEFNDNFWNADAWYEVVLVVGGCGSVVDYCLSTPNSSGVAATMGYSGSLAVPDNDLRIEVSGAPAGHSGLFFYGRDPFQVPMGDGFLCISPYSPGLFRLAPVQHVDGAGRAQRQLDLSALPPLGQITPGSTWRFQFWFRDSVAGGTGTNLSNGLALTFCP